MSLSEEERIRKLEKEIKEVQVFKTNIFNELEVRARRWTEFDEVKHKFENMFAGFENRLVKIEAKMEEERGKSKASGRIEKKPRQKPRKTVASREKTCKEASICRSKIVKRKTRRGSHTMYFLRNCTLHLAIFMVLLLVLILVTQIPNSVTK